MKNGIVLLLVIALLSGCGNVAHRSFVPHTSFDQQSNRKKDGDIGSAVCKDDANAALCSVVCQYKGQAEAGACNKSDQELLYKLFFVEIDEQGRFYDDRQFQYLLDYLNAKSKQDSCAKGGKGLTIVTIVHGWRHNAKEEDSNVKDAEQVLLHTYQAEQNPSYSLKCKAREVVGVYVGWRGKSLTTGTNWGWDPLELVSIYDRKNTALNVAMGSVREILSALQQFVVYREQKAASADNCIEGSKCKLDRLAIVGHSFGGLIVFNALSEGLLNSITGGYFVGDASVPPAVKLNSDLVILINPAIEAIKFEPIYQAIKRRGEIYANNTNGFAPNQRPVFVAITAKNDYATRGAFPFARWFSTFIEDTTPVSDMGYSLNQAGGNALSDITREERDNLVSADITRYDKLNVEEGEAKLFAMGHVERYWTHSLTIDTKSVNSPSCIPRQTPEWIGQYEKQTSDNLVNYYDAKDHTGNYCGNIRLAYLPSKSKVKNEKESLPYNSPVWIIRSEDARILDGHNGYGGSKLIIPFVQQLYHQLTLENNAYEVPDKAR